MHVFPAEIGLFCLDIMDSTALPPGMAEKISMVVLAFCTWYLEARAVPRKTVDFSGAFVIPLTLMVAGGGVGAVGILLLSFAVRFAYSRSRVGDLLGPLLVAMAGTCLQWMGGWPETVLGRLGLGLAGLALLKVVDLMVISQAIPRGSERLGRLEESEMAYLRSHLTLLPLLGAAVPLSSVWLVALFVPLLLLANRSAENVTFRLRAQQSKKAQEKAIEIRDEFRQVKANLASTHKKQQILGEIAQSFSAAKNLEDGFKELARLLKNLVPYRTLALVGFSGGRPKLRFYLSPKQISNEEVREPLLEQSNIRDGAIRGSSSGIRKQRLVLEEGFLMVVPLHPLGVLYFGREKESFTKAEASRAQFLVQHAANSLVSAEEKEQNRLELQAQSEMRERLQAQVSLSAKLLEGATQFLNCVKQPQVFQTLETLLGQSIPHRAGIILSSKANEPKWSWGEIDPTGTIEELHFRPDIAIATLASTPLATLFPGSSYLMSAPIIGERGALASMVIAFSEDEKPNLEQEDFLAACGCLVGSSLNSLQLSQEIKESRQRLAQASKMSAIGQLAASVAHELNTPLATISLGIQAALLKPERAGQRLGKAQDAVERAQHIVSQLLEHSHQGDGKRELLALDALFARVEEMTRSEFKKRSLKLESFCEVGEARIWANPVDMEQVLLNLLLNAADASGSGQTVQLLARATGNEVYIDVIDQGSGIKEEHKKRVFQAFFTTKDRGKGTGLGLSVSRQLVRRHAGKMRLESNLGEGTKFSMIFPARTEISVDFRGAPTAE